MDELIVLIALIITSLLSIFILNDGTLAIIAIPLSIWMIFDFCRGGEEWKEAKDYDSRSKKRK